MHYMISFFLDVVMKDRWKNMNVEGFLFGFVVTCLFGFLVKAEAIYNLPRLFMGQFVMTLSRFHVIYVQFFIK